MTAKPDESPHDICETCEHERQTHGMKAPHRCVHAFGCGAGCGKFVLKTPRRESGPRTPVEREVAIGHDAGKSPREVRLEALLRRALECALPGGLEDPEGCAAEGEWAEKLFAEARHELASGGVGVTLMTAVGPGASVDKPGDFAVSIREDGEFMTITQDGEASWIGEITLRQAADGAAKTLVKSLWGNGVSDEFRALALVRLYDRMDHDAREASLNGAMFAKEALALFCGRPPMLVTEPTEEDVERSVALLRVFDGMDSYDRRKALETLILVGFDPSRKFGKKVR